MFFPYRSDPRHTAQKQRFDVLIHYPYHPYAGERVFVVRTVQHAGTVHFVIDLADGTRGLLPEWMTEPSAANLPLVETATLSLSALRAVRATIDSCLLSCAPFDGTHERGRYVGATPESATGPSTSGSNVHRPRVVVPCHPVDDCRSAKAAPERVRHRRSNDEARR
jgi:hypothetical protein